MEESVLIVAAGLAFVIYRFAITGQFSPEKWRIFSFPLVQKSIVEATISTLTAFGLAAVFSLILGLLLSIGRLSDRAWVRVPTTLFLELFRAIPVLI